MTVDKVFIPSNLPRATSLVATNFPSIRVEEYEDTSLIANANEPGRGSSVQFEDKNPVIAGLQNFEVPINSFIYYSIEAGILVDNMVYPWHFLDIVAKNAES